MDNNKALLEVQNLKKYFPVTKGLFKKIVGYKKAIDDISFSLYPQEILGLVGESGSGKSTAGRTAIRLYEPTSGKIFFNGVSLSDLKSQELRKLRPQMQMIFQDPYASLNPRKNILENLGEALLYHGFAKNWDEVKNQIEQVLIQVGMSSSHFYRYPHQFSGGQQQRLSIARAIALKPSLLICDEALSALDVSIQAQMLNLLYELKQKYCFSILFISHDLSVVRNLCDRALVLYAGKIVESAEIDTLFQNPQHPYTKMLLSSIPRRHPLEKRDSHSPNNLQKISEKGCSFCNRCPVAKVECFINEPPLKTKNMNKGSLHEYRCIH